MNGFCQSRSSFLGVSDDPPEAFARLEAANDTASTRVPMIIGVAPAAIDPTTDFSLAASWRMMSVAPKTSISTPMILMILYFIGRVSLVGGA